MFDKRVIVAMTLSAWWIGCGAPGPDEPVGATGSFASHGPEDEAGDAADDAAQTTAADAEPASPSAAPDSGSSSDDAATLDDAAPSTETDATEDDCPDTKPTAGTSCAPSSGICGYFEACGITMASCVDGTWQVNVGAGCEGGGPPEGA